MIKDQNTKHYDLEDRTFKFAKRIRDYVKKLPRTMSNIEYGKQLIRSSGSQAANYIEANESLSKKDFFRTNENFWLNCFKHLRIEVLELFRI